MPKQLPLAPGKHASIREIMHFRRRPLVALPEIAAEFGPVARTVLGRQESVLVSDPELIRQVLVTDDWNFTKSRALARSKKLLGEGLLTSEGELHRRQRR